MASGSHETNLMGGMMIQLIMKLVIVVKLKNLGMAK
jgi:hypothetical protein